MSQGHSICVVLVHFPWFKKRNQKTYNIILSYIKIISLFKQIKTTSVISGHVGILSTHNYAFRKADIAVYLMHEGPVNLDSKGPLVSYVKFIFVFVK